MSSLFFWNFRFALDCNCFVVWSIWIFWMSGSLAVVWWNLSSGLWTRTIQCCPYWLSELFCSNRPSCFCAIRKCRKCCLIAQSIRCHFRFHLPNSFLSCEFTFLPSANIFTKGSTHEIWFLQQLPGIYSVIGTLLISSAVVSSGLKKLLQNLPIDHRLRNTPLLRFLFPISIPTETNSKLE